jgi:hypothetical protein
VVAPAGTPETIIGKLNAAINESLVAPEVTAAFAKLGAEVQPGRPQDFGAFSPPRRKNGRPWREAPASRSNEQHAGANMIGKRAFLAQWRPR